MIRFHVLQVNDSALSLRLVKYGSKVHLFYIQIKNRLEEGGERKERCHPYDLLCWLTVIWPWAPTDSLGEVPTAQKVLRTYNSAIRYRYTNLYLYRYFKKRLNVSI
jgi:hypothetical protein